ncbi:MAG: DUF4258 domain-containing protein [Candidatus Hydrothermarchaeales archaeon]
MVKNYKTDLIKKLKQYESKDVIFTEHAEVRAQFRRIDLEEIKNNLLDPKRLVFANKINADKKSETKYDCYFGYSKTHAHRYIIVVNRKVIIVTVIKINRRWQRKAEKHGRI